MTRWGGKEFTHHSCWKRERFLAGRQPVGFLWGFNHTHTHIHTLTHLQGSSLLSFSLRCKIETDFPEKTTSYKAKGADQQTSIAANRELTLQAFMIFFFPWLNEIRAAYCVLRIGQVLLRSADLSGLTENTPHYIVMLLQMGWPVSGVQ